jgi:polyferredoxin
MLSLERSILCFYIVDVFGVVFGVFVRCVAVFAVSVNIFVFSCTEVCPAGVVNGMMVLIDTVEFSPSFSDHICIRLDVE